jgi:ubiquitin C-terminal hydrolase
MIKINQHFSPTSASTLSLGVKSFFSEKGPSVAKVAAVALVIFAAYYIIRHYTAIEAHPNEPLGFKNYGFSCWVGAAMQALLACKHFEEIARRPLSNSEVLHGFEREPRKDTDEEFQQRVDVQNALIELFNIRKCGNQDQWTAALKKLHQRMSYRISRPGQADDSSVFFSRFIEIFQCYESIFNDLDQRCLCDPNYDDPIFGRTDSTPKIIITRALCLNQSNQINVNDPIDLSRFPNKGTYRCVGIVKQPPGHTFAYIHHENLWYRCNDEKVTKEKLHSMDLANCDRAVLELCEST